KKEKWDYIVLTGDLTIIDVLTSFQQYLKNPNNLIACRGNMDQIALPEAPVFVANGIKFGVYHGTGIYPRGDILQLKQIAFDMDVSVLLTGHSHMSFVHVDDEHMIINPGTGSGASGGSSWSVDIGSAIVELKNNDEIICELLLINRRGKLANDKFVFKKNNQR
nr:YfcE family phosphodiesterase [Asgard group archaeon]